MLVDMKGSVSPGKEHGTLKNVSKTEIGNSHMSVVC